MTNMVSVFKKSWHFVTEKIWHIRLDKVNNKRQGFFLKQLRIFTLAIRGFNEDQCLTKATALTFYTLFSIVPVLALAFAISKGFGLEKDLETQITASYPEYNDILSQAFIYANSMLASAKGGVIAGFGILLLLFSVINLLINIEDSFNQIWEIKKGRSVVRKITDYLTVMLISPLFLIIAGGLTVAIQAKMGNMHLLSSVSTVLVKLLAYALVSGVFTFIYLVLPNTKVNFKSAAVAGVISMILFELLQWAYLKFQIGANRMNAIYGGFAALPLFLIWVQYSWYVVLFGAEIAFANQNVEHYELENEITSLSSRYKKVISLMIANIVSKEFFKGEKPMTSVEIAYKLDLPVRLARTIINEFVETGIFVEMKHESNKEVAYVPGVTESKFTVKHIIGTLEKNGVNNLPINDTTELIRINELMMEMDKALDTELGSTLVRNIVK
jgi:membrane protein